VLDKYSCTCFGQAVDDVFVAERIHYGQPRRRPAEKLEAALKRQKNFDLDHNMAAHADWHAAGGRGRFLGTVKAPQVGMTSPHCRHMNPPHRI
jgi:hypothetical protein